MAPDLKRLRVGQGRPALTAEAGMNVLSEEPALGEKAGKGSLASSHIDLFSNP